MEKKSKIERIKYSDETTINTGVYLIIKKINEFIDHLNTQPQTGVFTEFTDKNISDDIPKGFVNIDRKLHKFEYDPEQKDEDAQGHEEWEDRLLLTDEAEREYVLGFIYHLLNNKEREAEENLLKRLYSAKSKKEFRDMLDELLNKK